MPLARKPTAVAGLDTASTRWHMWVNNGKVYKCICSTKASPDDRRQMLYNTAKETFALLPPGTLICAEEPLALKNGKTTRLLGLAAGAIWAAHLEFDVFWLWVDVATWKSKVCSYGANAHKDKIAEWVSENMHLAWTEEEDADFYDCAALARFGELVYCG